METAVRQSVRYGPTASGMQVRRTSPSRFCAFDIGDAELRDLAFGSLSPTLVAFVEESDPRWDSTAALLETVASDRLRGLLADPVRCRTAAPMLGHVGTLELLLIIHGGLVRRIDVAMQPADILQLVSAA